jgi:GAF domain-containing protein
VTGAEVSQVTSRIRNRHALAYRDIGSMRVEFVANRGCAAGCRVASAEGLNDAEPDSLVLNLASMSGTGEKTTTDGRYRALLDVSSAIAEQPTVKAVLHSLRSVLSSTSRLHGAELYVLGNDGDSLYILEFDREADAPAIKTGTKIARIGAAAQVLEEQKPVFIPDSAQEMLKHPDLAPFAAGVVGRSTYLFPVSTSQKRYGLLAVTKQHGQEFLPEDVELLRSLASHVAVALECALARDRAEQY